VADPDAVIDAGAVTDSDPATDLIVAGELCVDLIVGLDGDIRFGQHEQLVRSTDLTLGSSSAITACGAAALGVRTEMASVRGDDEFGDFIARELAARRVGIAQVRVDPSRPTGASTHLTRPDGDRAILTSMGSIGQTRADDVDFADARHLHVGSYFLQESLWADAAALYSRARAAGLSTSLDGNFDPSEQWDRGILEVLANVDILFGNEQELQGITGLRSLEAATEAALDRMPDGGIVVCKLGADGAMIVRREGPSTRRIVASTPSVDGPLVDTVGAGDTLAAGFIAGRLDGLSLEGCLALGVACGTASTRGAGGVSAQPSRAQADELARAVRISAG